MSQQKDKCLYLHDNSCGHPNKDPLKACASWKDCKSYQFLEETKLFFKEEKKNGKAETHLSMD